MRHYQFLAVAVMFLCALMQLRVTQKPDIFRKPKSLCGKGQVRCMSHCIAAKIHSAYVIADVCATFQLVRCRRGHPRSIITHRLRL